MNNYEILKKDIMKILISTHEYNPITKAEIMRKLDIDPSCERTVRRIITEELMNEMPIGSHSNINPGYYLIGSDVKNLEGPDTEDKKRALAVMSRRKRRRKAWEKFYKKSAAELDQLSLFEVEKICV